MSENPFGVKDAVAVWAPRSGKGKSDRDLLRRGRRPGAARRADSRRDRVRHSGPCPGAEHARLRGRERTGRQYPRRELGAGRGGRLLSHASKGGSRGGRYKLRARPRRGRPGRVRGARGASSRAGQDAQLRLRVQHRLRAYSAAGGGGCEHGRPAYVRGGREGSLRRRQGARPAS